MLEQELENYQPSWATQAKKVVLPQIATVKQESEKAPDDYYFTLKNDRLYSPDFGCYVRDIIKVNNAVGKLELQAFSAIEKWFNTSEAGVAAWVSPQDQVYYPDDSKVVFSEIKYENGEKRLVNRAIILDYDQNRAVELARAMAERSLNRPLLESVSAVRSTPIILAAGSWMDIGEELIVNPQMWMKIETGQDWLDQQKVLHEAHIIYEMLFGNHQGKYTPEQILSYFGEGGLSCPRRMDEVTPLGVFLAHSTVSESCSKIKCQKCSWVASDRDIKLIKQGLLTACPGVNGEKCGWKP